MSSSSASSNPIALGLEAEMKLASKLVIAENLEKLLSINTIAPRNLDPELTERSAAFYLSCRVKILNETLFHAIYSLNEIIS